MVYFAICSALDDRQHILHYINLYIIMYIKFITYSLLLCFLFLSFQLNMNFKMENLQIKNV